MSVNPGFGGQSFIDGTIQKIKDLDKIKKENNFTFQIQVDGGVKDTNSKKLWEAGANNLVAGSYIFGEKAKDYKSQIQKLK
jgi:ribulose-phosphate 3-epimerase